MAKNVVGLAAVAVAMACVSVAAAEPKTWYVDNKLDCYDGHDGSSWEKALHRIQDAVGKAASGDTVIVARGVYGDDQGTVADDDGGNGSNAHFSYKPNRIWIRSKNIKLVSSEGASVTHIVGRHAETKTGIGDGAVRCIAMSGSDHIGGTRIEGFTIRDGGTVAYGTGRTYGKNGETQTPCAASHCGGGLLFHYIEGKKHSGIHVVDCVISNCVAAEGAAAFGVSLVRCRVLRNRTCREGGETAAHCNAANSVFADNGAEVSEATVSSRTSANPVNVVNCTFYNNKGLMRTDSAKATAKVCNCFIQQCGALVVSELDACTFSNCVADCGINADCGNMEMKTRVDNAQLASPIYGDFQPVAAPHNPLLFGRGRKDFCVQDWIPVDDRNLDITGTASRWNPDDSVTVGAYQTGKEVKGGCIMVSGNNGNFSYAIDGRRFDSPNEGYFYAAETPSQHRIGMVPKSTGTDLHRIWFGGYYETSRYPGTNGSLVVTAPPFSSCKTLFVEARKAKTVIWTDPRYKGDDSDGSELCPYSTLQDAVDASAGKTEVLVKARKGSYATGGGFINGNCRVAITNSLCIRAVDGPSETFIVGGDGDPAHADGCGTNAYRCVGMTPGSKSDETIGVVGFTLVGGRTCTNAEQCTSTMKSGGGLLVSQNKENGQLVDCVIKDCAAIWASASYSGWLTNCRITDCRQAASNAEGSSNTPRGVVKFSYLSGCVIGPNAYDVVSVDQMCSLWNSTINETSSVQRCSKEATLFNVLVLNSPKTQGSIEKPVAGLVVETDADLAMANEWRKVADAGLADRARGDFRPVVSSPVIEAGTTNGVDSFARYTVGGIHGGLFPPGRPMSGASFDVAAPVVLTGSRGVSVSGGMGTPFVSKEHPLTLSATDETRTFRGFGVNGQSATSGRILTIEMMDGVSEFVVEPLYAKPFAVSIR